MENIFDPLYRQDYFAGYSRGQNPYYKITECSHCNQAFSCGFNYGRSDYESMNGSVRDGIPAKVVTTRVLEDFLLAGLLGMSIDAEGYTPFQLSVIEKWYQSGIEKYDADQSIYLLAILEQNGIVIR